MQCRPEPHRLVQLLCLGRCLCEPIAHPLRHGEVSLALVALEGLLERGYCLVGFAAEQEHLGEVGVCFALLVESVRPFADCDRLAREALSFGGLAVGARVPWL